MDLRLMRYFVTVAEELHFGRAAKRLLIEQQPLSHAIKKLEERMAVRLLNRTSRKVELTKAGEVFLAEAKDILRRTEEAVEKSRRAESGETGQISLGYVAVAMYNILPESVRLFQEKFPFAELKLHEMNTPEIENAVRGNALDIGIVCASAADKFLEREMLHQESLILALPENHPFASRSEISLSDLAAENFVLYPKSIKPKLHADIFHLCKSAGFEPRVSQEAGTGTAATALVSAGMGITFIAPSQAKIPASGIVFRPLAGPSVEVNWSATWKNDSMFPLLVNFLEVLRFVSKNFSENRLQIALGIS